MTTISVPSRRLEPRITSATNRLQDHRPGRPRTSRRHVVARDVQAPSRLQRRRNPRPSATPFSRISIGADFLDALDDTQAQVEQAFNLSAQFEQDPFSLSEDDLRAKTVPDWVAAEVDAPAEWFRTLQRPPNLWLRAKRGQGISSLISSMPNCRLLPDALVFAGKEDLFRTARIPRRRIRTPGHLARKLSVFVCAPQPGGTWWDACSGEGGKLMHPA